MRSYRFPLAALLLLAPVLFLANTWRYDLWPADEPRFGEVAREMMESGDYLVPHINNELYKEKPPLLFWAIVLISLPFGDVSEFTARAPSALAALLTILFTYLLAKRLYGPRVALWSALMLMTTSFFWWEARSVRTDMILTAAMTGSVLAFYRWDETRRRRWLLVFYAAITAGLYAKGPPALVFPFLLLLSYYWRRKSDRRELHWVIGFAVAVALVLVWYIPARSALPAVSEGSAASGVGSEAFRQIIGRLFLGVSKAQPPWYYFIQLPAGLLPWALFLPWAIPWVWRRRNEDDRMRLLLAWVVPAFIFFSISIGKRNVYLLPLYPALAILLSRSVLDLMYDGSRVRWRRRTAYVWAIILLILAAIPVALLATPYRDMWTPSLLALTVLALGFGVYTLFRAITAELMTLHFSIAAHFMCLALIIAEVFLPAINAYKGASNICRPLRELSLADRKYDLYTIGFSREEYIFYSRHFHQAILNDLLPVQLAHPIGEIKMADQQRRIRKAISKAVADIPVASIMIPTDAEVGALRTAVHTAIEEAGVGPELAKGFEVALAEVMGRFAQDFGASSPAFVFVQEDDWKWLLPVFPALRQCAVISEESVGQRQMLLLANAAGVKLVRP